MLCVGVEPQCDEPEVAVEYVAALNYRIRSELGLGDAAALHLDRRLEPATEAKVVDLLAHPPHDVLGFCHAGSDHCAGERGVDDGPHQLLHPSIECGLFRQSCCDEIQRKSIVANEATRPFFAECLAHSFHLAGAKAVAECKHPRDVHRDVSRVAFLDDFLQSLPLFIAPELCVALTTTACWPCGCLC